MTPTEPDARARTVTDGLVVAMDEGARRSGLSYWYRSRPWVGAVVDAARSITDAQVRDAVERLLAAPADPAPYWQLRALLADRAEDPVLADLFAVAWTAECNSRIGYHLGAAYRPDEPEITATDLQTTVPGEQLPERGSAPPVLIVVPFRDRTTGGRRARNLLACLRALRDQDYPRERYQVTVVETDVEPTWREVILPYCDRYVFAPRKGSFNKSWTVNVGVVQTGDGAELVSVLDADVLCDRQFLSRNVARFQEPGTGGHLTYRDMFCLDPAASSYSIRARLLEGQPEVSKERLRGFLLRRPPGACVWARTELYLRIGGMDERYEGWGGEDNDFAYRFELEAPLDVHRDDLLHMSHPPSSIMVDGRGINDHIPPLSWPADAAIGRLRPVERPSVSRPAVSVVTGQGR
ncbi:glycosyltransferase family 2 protein [Micromonospora sp. NPDC005652]|uniref:glycosyltransferase n=1 Tax=Micromonospora sp. NPDC005652 TaxID=3157046 RepID=UPI0033E077B7